MNDHRVHRELSHAYLKALSLSTFLSMNGKCFHIPLPPYCSLQRNLPQQLDPQLSVVEKPLQKAVVLYNADASACPNSCAVSRLGVFVIV